MYRISEKREQTLKKTSVDMGNKLSNTNIKDIRLHYRLIGYWYTSISNSYLGWTSMKSPPPLNKMFLLIELISGHF